MQSLFTVIQAGHITASAARALLNQGFTTEQIIRSCTVPAIS